MSTTFHLDLESALYHFKLGEIVEPATALLRSLKPTETVVREADSPAGRAAVLPVRSATGVRCSIVKRYRGRLICSEPMYSEDT